MRGVKWVLHIDGASRGNPGPAAIGVVATGSAGVLQAELGEYIGEATNNVAEYRALLRGLEMAAAAGATEVEICADSELLVRQVSGEYRVKSPSLRPLSQWVAEQLRGFRRWSIRHVPREANASADRLANQALDAARGATSPTRARRRGRAGSSTTPGSG